MKILHIIPSLGIGGTEKILFEICNELKSPDFLHYVISLKGGGFTEELLRKYSVPIRMLYSRENFFGGILDYLRLKSAIRKEIFNFKPDIVHTWLSRANIIGRLACRGMGVKVISSLRVIEKEKWYHRALERLTSSLADIITVNSHALEEFAVQKIRIPKEKIRLIHNGIHPYQNLNGFTCERLKKMYFSSGDFTIGTVGRLHRQKGVDIFLKAAHLILKRGAKVRFLVAGDGPELKSLQRLTNLLGIEKNVTFCGWIRNPLEFISLLDIFVLASRWEGCPNVILEALSLSKPVIATHIAGIRELIEHGKEGLLIPPEDIQACANEVIKLIENPSLRESVSCSAKIKVTTQLNIDSMLQKYSNLYKSLRFKDGAY